MKNYFTKSQERERLKELFSYNIIDTLPEDEFDHLVELAATICGTKYALLGFISDDRQWFKSSFGLDIIQAPREISFCNLAIQQDDEIMIIEDARLDERFKHNPLTTNNPNIVFYAGVPLMSPNGYALGAICILDDVPKKLTDIQVKSLKFLGVQVMALLDNRLKAYESTRILDLLEEANNELIQQSRILNDYKHAIDEAAIVAITDPAGNITYVNQKFCDISEYALSELMGQNQRIVNSGYHNPEFWKDFWSTISAGKVWSGEIKNKTKNGQFYWVDTTVIPFLDPNTHKPIQYLSIRKDITEHKLAMDKILNSIINDQENDREFLSHDIHEGLAQYLTAITYKIELIAEATKDTETSKNLGETHGHLLSSIEELRMLSMNLMPRTLLENGLIPALEQCFRSKNDAYNQRISLTYTYSQDDNLPVHALITIYRSMIAFVDYVILVIPQATVNIEFKTTENFLCNMTIQGITNENDSNGDFDALNNKYIQFKKRLELSGGATQVIFDYKNNSTKVLISFS
jgi:PAS domain S-box-containing protein